MKKSMIGALISGIMLITSILVLVYYAVSLQLSLPSPMLSYTYEADQFYLSWTSSEYATSYRIYSRDPGGKWSLFRAVGTDPTVLELPLDNETLQKEYSVKACHVAIGNTQLSSYSNVVTILNSGG